MKLHAEGRGPATMLTVRASAELSTIIESWGCPLRVPHLPRSNRDEDWELERTTPRVVRVPRPGVQRGIPFALQLWLNDFLARSCTVGVMKQPANRRLVGADWYSASMTTERYSIHAAQLLAEKYAKVTSEKQFAQSFWRDLFGELCAIHDLIATGIEFEYPVRSHESGTIKFVDVLWPGVVLIEHKSAGENLDKAEQQARDYLISLEPAKRPPVIILSDFTKFRIIEVLAGKSVEFGLDELPQNLQRFEAIVGDAGVSAARVEVEADTKAAQLMSELFIAFEKSGYAGHDVSVFLVRVLFLLFGDDTAMWRRTERGLFSDIIHNSPDDGSGLGAILQELFQTLNTPRDNRPTTLAESMSGFPYINGGIFAETLPSFSFNKSMRSALIQATLYDWSTISPAIFGSLFQSVRDADTRRLMGEHYTSETNILRCINDLFLNDFHKRMHESWDSPQLLKSLRVELGQYNWLDPACGSGNFLVVAYKRMRDIELRIIARLQELENRKTQLELDGSFGLQVHLGQFHGIEIDEWSASIARVAMFLADHQANLALEQITGAAPNRFPLTESASIATANALQLQWSDVCPMNEKTFIFGNPPFNGARWQSDEQKSDTSRIWKGVRGAGEMDFVSNWFLLAGRIAATSRCQIGFVSTNSIAQGEQASILWSQLLPLKLQIDFAHRSFTWTNGAPGQAAVTVVIIGYSLGAKARKKTLWKYETTRSEPMPAQVENINPFLLAAQDVVILSRSKPLVSGIPALENGNMPNDGGFLSNLSDDDVAALKKSDPIAAKYLRRLVGARELIHDEMRHCLWLQDADPSDIKKSPELSKRVGAVRDLRLASRREATRKLADRPNEFGEIRQPKKPVVVVPRITSELRDYVPIAVVDNTTILNDKVSFVDDDSFLMFAWLSSKVFNVWNKAVSGRTRNDTLISNTITYNNFPFIGLTDEATDKMKQLARNVLDARAQYPNSTLADLYDSTSMPNTLRAAHSKLDSESLAAYGLANTTSDSEILECLFNRYQELTLKA